MNTVHQRCLTPIATLPLVLLLAVVSRGADVNSVWTNSASGNWSLAGNWNPNANYPNNGGLTYNARGPTANTITVTLTEPITVQQYTNAAGTLTGDFPLTINELFTWSGGTISGNAPINVQAGAALLSGTKTLTGRTMNLGGGTATWSAGSISSGNGAVLNIEAPATFNITFNGQYNVTAGGSSSITNRGTFQKTGGTGASIAASFNNQPGGTVTAGSGILSLDGGGNSDGAFNISPGATLGFGGGTHVLNASSSVAGTGTNRVTAGSVTFAGTYDLSGGSTAVSAGTADFTGPNPQPGHLLLSGTPAASIVNFNSGGPAVALSGLTISGGTLGGGDSLNVSNAFTWSGGNISGSGVIQPLSGVTISGTGGKTLNGRTLNFPGGTTNTWLQGTLNSGSGAVLNLDPLAVFNISADGTYNLSGGSAVITNRGTVRKTGGTGNGSIIELPFHNIAPGVVESASGILSLAGGGSGDGTYRAGAGTMLRFGGGNHVLSASSRVEGAGTNNVNLGSVSFDGTYDVTGATLLNGGTASFTGSISNVGALILSGSTTATFDTGEAVPAASVNLAAGTLGGGDIINVAGSFAWSGGRLDGSGPFNVNGGSTWTGTGTKNLNARTLNLSSGTTAWSVGTVNSGGGATVNNAAVLDISFDGTFNASLGGSSTFNNSGTVRKSGGTGAAAINPIFNNATTGRVEVRSGTLNLGGGGSGSGIFDVAAGATLGFSGGAHSLDAASSLTGAGTNAVTTGSLTMNGTYNVTGGTRITGGSASFTGPTTSIGALTVSSGTAAFAGGDPVSALSAAVSGGTLSSSNLLNIAGTFNWTGGTLAGSGVINADGPLNLAGVSRSLNGRLNVNNAATWTAGNINSGQGAALTIGNSIVFDNTFDGQYTFSLGGSSTITNRGTFQKSGGVGAGGTVIGPVFNNASGATVSVTSGTLSLNGGGNSSGTFNTAAGSTLQFGGGTHFLDGASQVLGAGTNRVTSGNVTFGGNVGVTGGITVSGGTAGFGGTVGGGVPLLVSGGQANFNGASAITFASITLSGGSLGGTNDLTVSGPFNWNGGTLGGSGRLLANGGAVFANNNHIFSGRRLTVPSGRTASWNAGNLTADQGATLEIEGTLDIGFDGQFFPGGNGTSLIENTGTIRKSGGNGTASIGVPLNNDGTFEVNSGRVDLNGSGTGTGSFTAAANTTLAFVPSFGSGTYNLGAGSSIQGAGTISFEGATVNFGGTYNVSGTSAFNGGTVNFTSGATVQRLAPAPTLSGGTVNFDTGSPVGFPTLTLSGGTLGGTDVINVTNLLTWNTASISGSNAVNALGGAALNGSSRGISGRRLNLFGSSTWSAGSISVNNDAVIHIQPGATLDTTFNGDVSGIIGNGGITNSGTFRKSSGGGSTFFGVSFNNLGTVEVNSGTLDVFFGTYNQLAGSTVLNGGNLSVNVLFQLLGGVLTGAGTVTGAVTNSGVINPGAPLGILNVTGDYTQGPSGELHIDIGGTAPGTGYDQFNQTFGQINLNGTLSVSLTNGFLPNIGDSFRVLTFGSNTRTGDFSAFTGFDLGVSDRHLEAVYDVSGLTLVTRAGPLVSSATLSFQLLPPSTLELTWSNQFSDFHLESTTNLLTPNWQPFGTPGTNVVFVVVDPAEPQRYFRLEKP